MVWVESVRKPPMCLNNMLGSLVLFWEVKTEGKPPTSRNVSLDALVMSLVVVTPLLCGMVKVVMWSLCRVC